MKGSAMNRTEMNQALSVLNLEGLLLGSKSDDVDDDGHEIAFTVARVSDQQSWFCEGDAEGVPVEFDQVGCDQPAQWAVTDRDYDLGSEMFCSACLVERLGPDGHLKIIAGEVRLDNRPND